MVQLGIPETSMDGKPLKSTPDQTAWGPLSFDQLIGAAESVPVNSHVSGTGVAPAASREAAVPQPCTGEINRTQRLLGLFKTWLVIRYFFPHLELAGLDWDQKVRESVPKAEAALTTREYYECLRDLVGGLKDSHVRVGHASLFRGNYTIPARFRKVQGKTIVVEVAQSGTGLSVGDEVVGVDGQDIDDFEKMWVPRIAASLDVARFRDLYDTDDWYQRGLPMLGPEHSPVELMIKRLYGIFRFHLQRTIPSSEWQLRPKGWPVTKRIGQVAYIDVCTLPDYAAMTQAYSDSLTASAIILDMRGYPQINSAGLLAHWLVGPQGTKSGIFQTPVVAGPKPEDLSWYVEQYDTRNWGYYVPQYKGPVAVLIDERAQSYSEDVCIYLRNAGRAVFIGSPTAGTDGGVTEIVLPCGGKVCFTGARVLYGDGSQFQQIGIVPDVRVDPEVRDFIEGRDRVLEKAVEVLNAKLGAAAARQIF